MFIVFLTFGENKAEAPKYMEGHKSWIKEGVDQGRFILVGSLQPNKGGVVMIHGLTREELETCLQQDPFVIEGVVNVEVHEVSPNQTVEALSFLKVSE